MTKPQPNEKTKPHTNSNDAITIDPVAQNIVNRVAAGTVITGDITCDGGIMIEGTVQGNLIVKGGPLVLRASGVIAGAVEVHHDAYLLGTIRAQDDDLLSEIAVMGTAFLGSTLDAAANIQAGAMKTYEGSRIDGRIRTGQWHTHGADDSVKD